MHLKSWINTITRHSVLLLTIFLSLSAKADNCQLVLTKHQKTVVEYSYLRGAAYDMSYSLAAISLQESSAGLRRLNIADPSAGAYHILLKTAVDILKVEDDLEKASLLSQLVYDDVLGATLALHVLTFYHKVHKGDWVKTWASYNAGNNHIKGLGYAMKVADWVGKLDGCLSDGIYIGVIR